MKERDGICCPNCECQDLRVFKTRKTGRRIVRIRICRHCGRNIRTVEITVAEILEKSDEISVNGH